MSFVFCIVFALWFGFAASLAVDGLCCVTRSGRRGDWLSPSLLPFLPMDIKLCIEYENTPSLSELGSTTEPLEKCRYVTTIVRKMKEKITVENCRQLDWSKLQRGRNHPQALSLKPSFSRPIQSDPSLSPPNTIQANPIRTKIVSAAYLDFQPAMKLCLHTVQKSQQWNLMTDN